MGLRSNNLDEFGKYVKHIIALKLLFKDVVIQTICIVSISSNTY